MNANKKIKILMAEDLATDAEMAVRAIRSEEIDFEYQVVDTEKGFRQALQNYDPDIIISDYSMPTFDGMKALEITRSCEKYYPFIVLTGSMNEETAVACMKAGADDYVIKEQIKRLPFAVKEELARHKDRLEKITIENQLRDSEEKFRQLFQEHSAIKFIIDPSDGRIIEANQAAADFYGWTIEELGQMKISQINQMGEEKNQQAINTAMSQKHDRFDLKHCKADGTICDVEVFSSHVTIGNQLYLHTIVHDISEKIQAEEKNILLSRSIEQSPVGIVITNKSGVIDYVNAAFTKFTGYTFDEAVGANPKILNSGHHTKSFYDELWKTIQSGKDWHGEIRNRKKNGQEYWEEMIISPVLNSNNEITHFIAVKEDVTEKKTMIEDLVEAKKRAEESDHLKSAFLANMSHEIRTPMNGILGFTELLKEPDLSKQEMDQYVRIIQSSGNRMMETVNSIIEISKIETGQVRITKSATDIHREISEIVQFFELEASKKGLEILMTEENEKLRIHTDRFKLQSVLTNLVKNAIKYTETGTITLGCSTTKKEVIVYVKDSGIGIPEDKQEKIFNRFEQADVSLTRGHEGSGLGLSISKAYVEMLGGRIWVESTPGKGTTFWFSLPLP